MNLGYNKIKRKRDEVYVIHFSVKRTPKRQIF